MMESFPGNFMSMAQTSDRLGLDLKIRPLWLLNSMECRMMSLHLFHLIILTLWLHRTGR